MSPRIVTMVMALLFLLVIAFPFLVAAGAAIPGAGDPFGELACADVVAFFGVVWLAWIFDEYGD